MWAYLKAAFWARPEIPGFGRLPLNVLFSSGIVLLGFGHPGFWFAGAALETAYLYALTTNPRFQNLVDAETTSIEVESAETQREVLIQTLTPPRRQKLEELRSKCRRVLQMQQDVGTDDLLRDGNREALQRLKWLYLKLLVAEQNISSLDAISTQDSLQTQIDRLVEELSARKSSASLRDSKEATLRILRQRLTNLDRRGQNLEEIASDLTRIEAQVDLALENAGMRGETTTISTNIDLVSQLLDDSSIYGDSGASIAAIEQSYGTGSS